MHGARIAAEVGAWFVALNWLFRVVAAHLGLPSIPDLRMPEHDLAPAGVPSLVVIVPARNEEGDIRACLESLVKQDYLNMRIVAVDDRSTDATGARMDEVAFACPARLMTRRIADLPAGWLGKTHAMAMAAREAIAADAPDFLLFTDADVIFRPDALRRGLANAVATGADHLVLIPTTIIRRWDEAALLGFFQIFGLWGARPWKVADPEAKRDAIGIGAFNLIRTSAYLQVGGFEALRMEIVEDLGLARRVKAARLRQRVAFGQGMVSLHWAAGVPGLVKGMTKNVFSILGYNEGLVLAGCLWLLLFCIAPFAGVWVRPVALPSFVTVTSIVWGYVLMRRPSGLSAWNAVFAPFAAAMFILTLLRSMAVTLWQGGVVWRGTFYPLDELRKNAAPLP